MKKLLFSLVMMFALVIVAGTAMAQTKTTPYAGGKYTYTINGLKVNTTGTATIITSSPSNMIVSNIVDQASASIALTAITPTTTALTFDVAYDQGLAAGPQIITFELTDGAGCKNNIHLDVTVMAKPTMAVAIIASETTICQNLKANPSDNTAASIGANTNSFTFTVTPTLTNVTTAYNYTYTLALPNAVTTGLSGYTITPAVGNHGTYAPATGVVTGTGTLAADATADVYTITFTTTTGIAPVTVTGTLSLPSLTVTSGGGIYTGSITAPAFKSVEVKTTPSIGTFN